MTTIERQPACPANKVPANERRIEVTTTLASGEPPSPAEVMLKVD